MLNNMDDELKNLYKTFLLNAANYLASDCDNLKSKTIFLKHIAILNEKLYYENLHDLKFYLEEKIGFIKDSNRWWSVFKSNKAELDAYELALDICNSFLIRFVDGGAGDSTQIIKKA